MGFYLLNLGYVRLQLRLEASPGSAAEVLEALARKIGFVLVVLGIF